VTRDRSASTLFYVNPLLNKKGSSSNTYVVLHESRPGTGRCVEGVVYENYSDEPNDDEYYGELEGGVAAERRRVARGGRGPGFGPEAALCFLVYVDAMRV
jgi:hypothetical protein